MAEIKYAGASPAEESMLNHIVHLQAKARSAHWDGFLLGVFVGLIAAIAMLVLGITIA